MRGGENEERSEVDANDEKARVGQSSIEGRSLREGTECIPDAESASIKREGVENTPTESQGTECVPDAECASTKERV